MAIFGQPTIRLLKREGEAVTATPRSRFNSAALRAICWLAVIVLGGCAAPSFKLGKPPAVERLSQLTVGVSTAKDVVAVLGEPQGRGATRSPSYGLKDAWLYESTDTDGVKASVRMLMVFLDKGTGVYRGHMWMAGGVLLGQTKE